MSLIKKGSDSKRRDYASYTKISTPPAFFRDQLTVDEVEKGRLWADEVRADAGNPDRTFVVSDGETVTVKDVKSLLPHEWLTDSTLHYVINAMKKKIGLNDPTVHIFKSFFIEKLFESGVPHQLGDADHANVARWTKKLFSKTPINTMKKIVFFQNHSNIHWKCYCIFMKEKTIECFDSTGGNVADEKILEGLYHWLEVEMEGLGRPIEAKNWHLYLSTPATPRQGNSWDCGIYMLLFGLCIAQGQSLALVTPERVDVARRLLLLHFLEMEEKHPVVYTIVDSPMRKRL